MPVTLGWADQTRRALLITFCETWNHDETSAVLEQAVRRIKEHDVRLVIVDLTGAVKLPASIVGYMRYAVDTFYLDVEPVRCICATGSNQLIEVFAAVFSQAFFPVAVVNTLEEAYNLAQQGW